MKRNRSGKSSIKTTITIIFLLITMASMVFVFASKTMDTRSRASLTANQADVVVAGAGTGGIGAAIQAARLGANVLLVEETDYIGGQAAAAGVSTIDVGMNQWNSGLYNEFEKKINAVYADKHLNIGWPTCVTSACYEPSVIRQVLSAMVSAEPNITLLLKTGISSVQKDGDTIKSVLLTNGRMITTNLVIDATEYGDVIPLAGASYRIGNGTNTNPNPNACVQDITYTAVVKKYPNGVPASLQINAPPPGYTPELETMFASIVKDGATGNTLADIPVSWTLHNRYRGMPNSSDNVSGEIVTKTGINWANDYDRDNYISPTKRLSTRYIEDKTYRKDVNCQAKLRTIQFLYYMQHNNDMKDWSVATDEGYNTAYNTDNLCSTIPDSLKEIEKNMPVMPYVRESRRGIGLLTLSARDIKREGTPARGAKTFASSIALGTYGTDLHNCNTNDVLETAFETSDDNSMGGPFQVPMETLISKDVSGLLFAEKNISQTRLANGATRLQPVTMLVGQAAGALAAEAAKAGKSPKDVPAETVQKDLIAAKTMLFAYSDVPVSDTAFSAVQYLTARGITSGIGNLQFSPNGTLSRAEAAILITRAFALPTSNTDTSSYTDVEGAHAYLPFIEAITNAGITAGCSLTPKKFCPDERLTNAQFAVFAFRGWARSNTALAPQTGTSTYSDIPSTEGALPYIEGLAQNGIRWYCSAAQKSFCPNEPITRAQASIVLRDILYKMGGSSVGQGISASSRTTTAPKVTATTKPTAVPTTTTAGKYTIDGGMCKSLAVAKNPTEIFPSLRACVGRLNELLQLTQHP